GNPTLRTIFWLVRWPLNACQAMRDKISFSSSKIARRFSNCLTQRAIESFEGPNTSANDLS
ncbi:hypothetical protein, partial [Leuconostoc mesenteroides]|uniref:hypothetical protein n=1 Tax=Leuconostoc mesenteroides TaxID=1245 RepID=UPI001EE42102